MAQKQRSPAGLARDEKKQQQAAEAEQVWAEAAAIVGRCEAKAGCDHVHQFLHCAEFCDAGGEVVARRNPAGIHWAGDLGNAARMRVEGRRASA